MRRAYKYSRAKLLPADCRVVLITRASKRVLPRRPIYLTYRLPW